MEGTLTNKLLVWEPSVWLQVTRLLVARLMVGRFRHRKANFILVSLSASQQVRPRIRNQGSGPHLEFKVRKQTSDV